MRSVLVAAVCLLAFSASLRAQGGAGLGGAGPGEAGPGAADLGTPEQAKALAERAAAHLLAVGPVLAVRDFNAPNGGWRDRNLFVVTYDPARKVVSSPGLPAFVGRDARRFVDADGMEFGNEIIHTAESDGVGWVAYCMTDPATLKVELKRSYVVKAGEYIVFVGAYGT